MTDDEGRQGLSAQWQDKYTRVASQSSGEISRWGIGVAVLILLYALLCIPAINLSFSRGAEIIEKDFYITRIAFMFKEYANKHGGKYPNPARWCDILNEGKSSRSYLFGGDSKDCGFGLNIHAAEYGEDIPADMVFLFSTGGGWNIAGDFRDVSPPEHKRFVTVLYGNFDVDIVRPQHVRYLKWKPEDSGIIPRKFRLISYIVPASIPAVFILYVLFFCRTGKLRVWVIALPIGMVSVVAIWIFGGMAEVFLYQAHEMFGISAKIGLPLGLAVGIGFVLLVFKIKVARYPVKSVLGPVSFIGAITGIVTSCVVHGFLMIVYEETRFVYMIFGQGFGLVSGLVLGLITSGLMRWCEGGSRIIEIQEGASGG